MASNNKYRKSLHQQIYNNLTEKFRNGKGQSRHEHKKAGTDRDLIFSEKTYRTYMNECDKFAKWCKTNYSCTNLRQCKKRIEEYLNYMIDEGRSAWTISTSASAIAKLYGIKTTDLKIELPTRKRADIKRSRLEVEKDKHISEEKRAYWENIGSCIGLRISELKAVRGTDLVCIDDTYYINVRRGKGGKQRQARVIGTEEQINNIVNMFQGAKNGYVFNNIPQAIDNHHSRAIYATNYYNMVARNVDELDFSEKYICRKDKRGQTYDRKAMLEVSQALGHNRIDIIAYNYLYI